ncbi:tRNA-guanine transglycosylase [Patescibacteria group bacterium]|nr:tRNA-guanine transglycosylase [Patescibacteria group bacterium]MBU4601275.1 tRNA-guanine transglycosylase [Patescibacteria group bacterium]MCG2698085.1 tRNA-guanine transglycosylase [Candidatus Parcubacteria bacterium]
MFKIIKKSNKSRARLGMLKTAHGNIQTPFFMPCATQGAVKHVSTKEVGEMGARILLANTYHLMLRPGEKLIKKAGGLHDFMNWQKPILTDSGGFQIFSLSGDKSKSGKSLVKLEKDGVRFKSYIDGEEYYLTPEKALKIQIDLGVDIAVCLDVCPALPAKKEDLKNAVELTSSWAKKTKNYAVRIRAGSLAREAPSVLKSPGKAVPQDCGAPAKPLVFCVIQGGLDKKLRLKSLRDLVKIGWDGYNIGGLSVGESSADMYKVLDYLAPEIPENKPRYLMGAGYPENIVEAVKRGVDMFDCVIPTREGRHGRLFQMSDFGCRISDNFYNTIHITRAKFVKDFTPINPESKLPELRGYSKAYLRYLFKIKEPLGQRLASLNNLEFYFNLMENIRRGIKNGRL